MSNIRRKHCRHECPLVFFCRLMVSDSGIFTRQRYDQKWHYCKLKQDLLILTVNNNNIYTTILIKSYFLYSLSGKLNLNEVLPNKITIWKLRNNNSMRNSFNNNNIKLEEFEALIKLTAEMSKFLYPYIRQILQSRDDLTSNPKAWNEFKSRYIELISERFNTNSMKVKRLLDPNCNDEVFNKIILTLALCVSDDGFLKLRTNLLNY